MKPRRPAAQKLLPRERLEAAVRQARERGESIVFTNGCFDLLHAGHLRMLEAAAGMGRRLLVAINEDASVRAAKGPDRPLVRFEERALLVAGLDCVDWVVGFDEPTPLALIEAVRPDVLVKGADWAADRIVGRDLVEAAGGRVERVDLLEGWSTSALIERARGDARASPAPERAHRD